MFGCKDISLASVSEPKMNSDQAISILKKEYPDASNVTADLDLWLTENGNPWLRWTVKAERPNRDDGTPRGVILEIDDLTGEIIRSGGY